METMSLVVSIVYETFIISTIVDQEIIAEVEKEVYETFIISTIVDHC